MNPSLFPKHRGAARLAWVAVMFLGVLGPMRASPEQAQAVVAAARAQVGKTTLYDPAYVRLGYPGGDVPLERGVCTDVVIRAFRALGVDLQQLVHDDMKSAFRAYPQQWGLARPDPNIDHRRVPNLMTFFRRRGKELPHGNDATFYEPGDVVAWRLPNGLLHIGVVADTRTSDGSRPLLVHNIGAGARLEDVLFAYEIIGHYRYF